MTGPHADSAASDIDLHTIVAAGAADLGVGLDAARCGQLVAYIRLIERWTATYNLTAIRGPRTMATHHIVDSLAVLRPLRAVLADRDSPSVLDVGSGAGLPGVVIAIAEPSITVTCVDSVGKKAAFVRQVAAALGLTKRLGAIHARVESLSASTHYDAIVSRAFASLADFIGSTRRLLAPGGHWVAMKGKTPHDEIDAAHVLGARFVGEAIQVPALNAERCILIGHVDVRSEPGLP